ncbi:MAG TPA: hypothetical protein VN637_01855 [Roseiarcus sp.]|nr:hypothetical protein [Roseiarcus sp.]
MTEDPQSARAKARAAASARRRARTAFRQGSFDLLASGYSVEQIADARKVSVRTIQREIDSVIAARRLDAPERYVHLQVARLTKALRLADVAIEQGELKGVQALLQVVKSLDRYHGLSKAPAEEAGPSTAVPAVAALPPPLLGLTHNAPATEPEVERELADESENATDFDT